MNKQQGEKKKSCTHMKETSATEYEIWKRGRKETKKKAQIKALKITLSQLSLSNSTFQQKKKDLEKKTAVNYQLND